MSDGGAFVPLRRLGFGETRRPDAWWSKPLLVFLLLSGFVAYATWAMFQDSGYSWGPYLAPMDSPEIFGSSPHAWFGPKPSWYPGWLPFSPALLILWAPAGFRLTCYYYRGAYYKAFWASPPACAVGKPQKSYRGEAKLPLIIQNVHRFLVPFALLLIVFLGHDAYKGFFGWGREGHPGHFEVHVGSLILLVNVVLLACYTFGCHSLRHLVGGGVDEMSKTPLRHQLWRCASCFNRHHMGWAWPSLIWVSLTDIYVRLCAHGVVHDVRLF